MTASLCSAPGPAVHRAPPPLLRPVLAEQIPKFILLERDVEEEFRARMLEALQHKVQAVSDECDAAGAPTCPHCDKPMNYHDAREVSWVARFGKVTACPTRYRCKTCEQESLRPLIDVLGVEPGRISGSLARLLALLGVVVPYELAASLAFSFFGVKVNAMTVWRVVQRLGAAREAYTEAMDLYHADARSVDSPATNAPAAVVLGVDGCFLGMQVRARRRRRQSPDELLPPLTPVEEGHFREVKTGVVLLPAERFEPSAGRQSVLRRWVVSCLGDADAIFGRLWAKLQELGFMTPQTVVVIVGDGAEWIWKRAEMFVNRCEILDFWHAVEHAWQFARLRYGQESKLADRWVHRLTKDLRAGKVQKVIRRLKAMRSTTSPEAREQLKALIRYYSDNAHRMRYDEYLEKGYGIGSGAVESAHKQVVHARLRQAGMRWSELGAQRLLALRVLLLNDEWEQLDRLRMVSLPR